MPRSRYSARRSDGEKRWSASSVLAFRQVEINICRIMLEHAKCSHLAFLRMLFTKIVRLNRKTGNLIDMIRHDYLSAYSGRSQDQDRTERTIQVHRPCIKFMRREREAEARARPNIS